MFLTRPSVSQSFFFLSATSLEPLHRISWNVVVMKDIMCKCAYPQEILFHFFSRSHALMNLEIWPKWKKVLKQFVSATPLKPLNRIYWNFVVVKDIPYIPCRCAYPQENLIHFFFLGVKPFLNLEIWPKWTILLKQLDES